MKKSTKKTPKSKAKSTKKATKAKAKKVKVVKAKAVKKVGKVSKACVMKGIARMTDEALAKKATDLLNQNGSDIRTGSTAFAAKKSDLEVTMAEKKLMLAMQRAGLSYRNLEPVFRLLPANGMNAFRCVKEAHAEIRADKVRKTKAANLAAQSATADVQAPVPVEAPVAPVAEAPATEAPAAAVEATPTPTPAPVETPTPVEQPPAAVEATTV